MNLVAPVSAVAVLPDSDPASPAVAPRGIQYTLTLSPGRGALVTDPPALRLGSIVRILRGAHTGVIGRLDSFGGGAAWIAKYPIRYRRRLRVQIGTGLRVVGTSGKQPHTNPGEGDRVDAYAEDWRGEAIVCGVEREYASVREASCAPGKSARIRRINLCPEPAIEVLIEPALHGPDGTVIPIAETFVEAFAEALLETIGRMRENVEV
jgi:hypothetical protein